MVMHLKKMQNIILYKNYIMAALLTSPFILGTSAFTLLSTAVYSYVFSGPDDKKVNIAPTLTPHSMAELPENKMIDALNRSITFEKVTLT